MLVVEQADGEPVAKSNTKMITGVLSGNPDTRRLSKIYNNTIPNSLRGNSSQTNFSNGSTTGPGSRLNSVVGLASLNTKDLSGSGSSSPIGPSTVSGGANSNLQNGTLYTSTNDSNENIIYPIKLRDMGSGPTRKTYYIYTQTEEERKTWVNKILLAKREYASLAFALNSEPFKVRVVEDRFFGYDPADTQKLPVYAQATALDRSIEEYESMNGPVGITATATLGINGSTGGTASSLVSSLGFQSNGHNYNNAGPNGTTTITKTSTAMIKAQVMSTINCVVTCNVGGRFFIVAGLENGLYACDMTMRRVPRSDIPGNSTKGSKNKKKNHKNTRLSPGKLPVKLPYNPYDKEATPSEELSESFNEEGDDDDMTAWEAPQWVRCLDLTKVTQLEVLTEYNVLLVLADKTLIWYHLDQILSIVQNQNRKSRDPALTGYAISRNHEASFFATGYMTTSLSSNTPLTSPKSHSAHGHGLINGSEEKQRELLFYRKKDVRETLKRTTTIEVVEPVKEKGSQKRRSQFVASAPALTKKSVSRSHYGISSTAGHHIHNNQTSRFPNQKSGVGTSGILKGTAGRADSTIYGNNSPVKNSLKAPEDLLHASMKSRINVGATSTEYFRGYDAMTLLTDSFGITLFSSSLFAHTSRGFELLALSYQNPRIVPDPDSITPALSKGGIVTGTGLGVSYGTSNSKPPSSNSPTHPSSSTGNLKVINGTSAIETFKRTLEASKPVGAFMLADNTILLVYDQVAIFVDKFGNMSLPVVINMLSKIKSAVVSYPYLVAVSDDMVEVRRLDLNVKKFMAANRSAEMSSDNTDAFPIGNIRADISKVPLQPVNGNVNPLLKKKGTNVASRFGKRGSAQVSRKKVQGSTTDILARQFTGHGNNLLPMSSPSKSSTSSSSATLMTSNSLCPLKQVITGKHIRLVVANTRRSTKTGQEIIIAMAHPKYPGRQLLLELIKNEFVCDDENSSLSGL